MIPPFTPAPPLPGDLAERYTVRPVDVSDAVALYELSAAYERSIIGTTAISKEEILADLTSPSALASVTQAAVVSGDRIVAAPWMMEVHPDHLVQDVFLSVDLDSDQAAALFAWGCGWADDAAQEALRVSDVSRVQLGSWCHEQDTARAGWLTAAGYHPSRSFIEMTRPLPPDEQYPAPAPGVVVRRAQVDPNSPETSEAAVVHAIVTESFEDHFNFSPSAPEVWLRRRVDDAGFDPSLWFLAELDGVPVGAMVMNRGHEKEHRAGYIHYLGTLRSGRGRGVAKALLWRAFGTNRADGLASTTLSVDAESPTGATALYESVGMTRERVTTDWQKWVDRS